MENRNVLFLATFVSIFVAVTSREMMKFFFKSVNYNVIGVSLFINAIVDGFYLLPETFGWPSPLKIILDALLANEIAQFLTPYWLGVILAFALVFANYSDKLTNLELRSSTRKLFHLMAILIFIPGFLYNIAWLRLCFECAIALFVLIEFLRYTNYIPRLSSYLHAKSTTFLDKYDSGPLILTHIFLLIGCAFPLLVDSTDNSTDMATVISGTILLGVGDSFASIIGSKFGSHRWISSSKKTVEGTVAAYLSVRFAFFVLNISIDWRMELATAFAVLFEGVLTQVDNLCLPIIYLTLIRIFKRF